MIEKILKFFLENKLVTFLLLVTFILWGVVTAPFGWDIGILPVDPVAVDAIPDIGETSKLFIRNGPDSHRRILMIRSLIP